MPRRSIEISTSSATASADTDNYDGAGNNGGTVGCTPHNDTTAGGSTAARVSVPDENRVDGVEHWPSTRKLLGGSSASPTVVRLASGWGQDQRASPSTRTVSASGWPTWAATSSSAAGDPSTLSRTRRNDWGQVCQAGPSAGTVSTLSWPLLAATSFGAVGGGTSSRTRRNG